MIIEIGKENYRVEYTEDPMTILWAIKRAQPKWITYDTETTGLHIKKDRPFLGAVCFDDPVMDVQGVVFVFHTTPKMLQALIHWSENTERVYAHNTVYDMNMSANIAGEEAMLAIKNWGDTMGLCRIVFESVSVRDGGDSLALKKVGDKYIDATASRFEKDVKRWLSEKKKADRQILLALLKGFGWTAKRFEAAMNTNAEPLPPEIAELFFNWQQEYPEPSYQDVPLEIMLPYLAVDVILTNILVRKSLPVVAAKKQEQVMEEEFALIPVVFKMSRIGIKVDRDYLFESFDRLTKYIDELEAKLFILSGGREISVNQHAKIKEMYTEILGEAPKSTDKKFMSKQAASGDKLAKVISLLRTLEKWRATYIERFLDASSFDGRFYATLDQFNPISGRFSGDLQQQPKKAIKYILIEVEGYDEPPAFKDGEELFHPRKAFLADTDDGYDIFLLDFSQVELRFQAHYTLPFGGDLNLCRAYMPFKCVHYMTGEDYDYSTEEGKARWAELRHDFNLKVFETEWYHTHSKPYEPADVFAVGSAWIIPETGELWKPTDVHSASTKKALALMGIDWESLSEKDFQTWRGLGKGVNFAKNYGVGINGAAEQFGLEVPVAKALCDGYNEAFPMVITYQNNVSRAAGMKGFVSGVYGRRYYLSDPRRFYKLANYLIQGSCAHDLKLKMLQLDELLASKKSAMLTCIHDEIVFRIHRSERYLIPQIKAIMEYTPKINVPIISEVDYTETNWADKQKYKGA